MPSSTPPGSQTATSLPDVRVGDEIHVWLRAGAPLCTSPELGCRIQLKVRNVDASGIRSEDGLHVEARFIEHVEREQSRRPAILTVVGAFVVLLLLAGLD